MHEPILSYRDQHELNVNALLVFLIASVYAVHYQLHNTKNTSRTPKTYFSSAQLFTFTHTCPRWLYGLCYNCVRIRQHNIGLSRHADSITTPVQSRHWSIPGNSPLVRSQFITLSVHLCSLRVCRDAARRAGSSATADTYTYPAGMRSPHFLGLRLSLKNPQTPTPG